MHIIKVTLVDYIPFANSGKYSVVMSPKRDMVVIIGTNGSGKSSLLNELNPLPGIRASFGPEGYKSVEVEHLGNRYTLTSTLGKKQKHSIIDQNGEELNPSGTLSVQKELVETIFNYTAKIHKILTGKVKFTTLPAVARRELLMSICPIDLDYGNALHARVVTATRDAAGAYGYIKNKVGGIEADLATIDVPAENVAKVQELRTRIEALAPYTKQAGETGPILNKLSSLEERLATIAKLWKSCDLLSLHKHSYTSRDAMVADRSKLATELEHVQARKDTLLQEQAKLMEIVGTSDTPLDVLVANLADLQREYDTLPKVDAGDIDTLRIPMLLKVIQGAITAHEDILTGHELAGRTMSIASIDDAINEIDSLGAARSIVVGKVNRVKADLDHLTLEFNSSVVCPKCETRISMGMLDIPAQIESEKARLKCLETEEYSLSKTIEEMVPVIREGVSYKDLVSNLASLRSGHAEIWHGAPSTIECISNPTQITTYLQSLAKRLSVIATGEGIRRKISELDKSISIAKLVTPEATTRVDELEAELLDVMSTLANTKELAVDLDSLQRVYDTMHAYSEESKVLMERIERGYKLLLDVAISNDAIYATNDAHSQLGGLEFGIKRKESLEVSLADSTKDSVGLKDKLDGLTKLLTSVSPVKGVIAEQMIGFLNSYTDSMNTILEDLWSYPMSINPISNREATLDYKFPLTLEEGGCPDVADSSEGQRDVVDFAFVLVMRAYLGLEDYPMYLDEPGTAFDEHHRAVLFSYIKGLNDTNQCSQCFMVSHYATMHGGLSNTETIVLDKRNVTVPSVYNENTVITMR